MVYKLLALNIDGTLLQDNGKMNKLTRDAIEYAQKKDIVVTLVTSKNFQATKRIAKALKIDGNIVTHQGAYVARELNRPIFVKRINEQITSEIITLLEAFQCQIKVVHDQFSLVNKVNLPDHMMAKVIFQTATRFTYSEQVVDKISEKLVEEPVSPLNIEVTFEDKGDAKDAMKAISSMYEEVSCILTSDHHVQIVPSTVSKLQGIQYLCQQLGIQSNEVVAIGAGRDDLPLIEWAGLGVAMKNAPLNVQKSADWVTRSNNDNGVAYMVKEHFRKQYKLAFLKKINAVK